MPARIVTSTYRYKRLLWKRKAVPLEGPAIVVGKRSRRLEGTAAAKVISRSPRHHDGAVQPSTLRKTEREPPVTAPLPGANDDRKSSIVTASKRRRRAKPEPESNPRPLRHAGSYIAGNPRGGIISKTNGTNQAAGFALAESHCHEFGRVAQVTGMDVLYNRMMFACVDP